MLERARFVIATGRFQTIHLGSLGYLVAAKSLAVAGDVQFRVLTGPLDSELRQHGSKQLPNFQQRRHFQFEERQFLISLLLSIPIAQILNNRSSPHHGEPGLSQWIGSFFDGIRASDGNFDAAAAEGGVTLAVVRKASDFKAYKPDDGVMHYSDYLKKAYPWLRVNDLNGRADTAQDGRLLGSADLASAMRGRAPALPAAMLAAELLADAGRYLTEAECRTALGRIAQRYGHATASYEDVRSALGTG